jgi:amino acid transporter
VNLRDLVLGRRLRSSEGAHERIGPLTGVALLGLDALSSAAYGPEVALFVLAPLGIGGVHLVVPIFVCIVAILFVVYASYRQTIRAYPNGGGSYVVARENLGPRWGLFAAAALGLDYVLNVAVGISAGVGALVSAVPALAAHTVALCIALLALLTLINLRGVRESGAAWRIPTWIFIATMLVVLVMGAVRAPHAVVAPAPLPPATGTLTLWLLVRAFSTGCAAMTGVEAVSNGVPLFRRPADAMRTLTIIIAILAALLLGVSLLASAYGIGAMPQASPGYRSVLLQLIAAVAGTGWFYGLTTAAIVAVLAMSANTSFADFPRVCHFLAADEFLPPSFGRRGRRLVYTQGIVLLAAIAAALLVGFRGVTDSLVQLFAIGAFLAFTLSQAGMVAHWRKRRAEPGARAKMIVNAVGAAFTGVTAIVLLVSKFTEGAWLILLLIPGLVAFMSRMQARHQALERVENARVPIDTRALAPPLVVVPMIGWNRPVENAIRFALQTSPDVRAVRVVTDETPGGDLVDRWESLVAAPARAAGHANPQLEVLHSEYRTIVEPIVDHVRRLARDHPRRVVEVVVPELFERHWYDYFTRNRYPEILRSELLRSELLLGGEARIVVVTAPSYVP